MHGRFNASEVRALQRGHTIVCEKRNGETGELYQVDVRLSWDRLYFSCDSGSTWHRTAKAARLAECTSEVN